MLLGTASGKQPDRTRATLHLAQDLPGELSEDGPRHNNDHAEICDISILPTHDEIQSSRSEYLPVANHQDWHLNGISGLVDRAFRLLREDTVGQLRDAAKLALERLQYPKRHITPKHREQGARTYVYSEVSIAAVGYDDYHGAQVALRFTRPEANNQASQQDRREWWDHTRRLGPEALVCLLSSEGSATFLVVGQQGKKPTRLQNDFDLVSDIESAYIVVKPLNDLDLHQLLSQSLKDSSGAQLSIIEFPGVLLPSFEPTLKALQHISQSPDLPFSHLLVPAATPEQPGVELEVQPPTFATKPGFQYDLSGITTDNKALFFTPGEDIGKSATELTAISSLDHGQARAVVASLARSFAAIQGPPGTGKSYTGTQLIRILLANEAATSIGPIVICTHTNHALDSILERSVDDGAVNIVRVGGRSKSERLQDINLRLLAQNVDKPKWERQRYWELSQDVYAEVLEINNLLESLETVRSHSAVKEYLLANYRFHHDQIFGITLEEGDDSFETVRHKQESRIDIWLERGHPGRGPPLAVDILIDMHAHAMTSAERRLMLHWWVSEMNNEILERIRHATAFYSKCKTELAEIRTEQDLRVLRQANIIGITTSGMARHIELLGRVGSKVLICEEAGEVLEAHMLTALIPSIEQCILIGDHQQLRPQVQNYDLSTESRNGGQYALDVSLFERLVRPKDIFAQAIPLETLEVQRRMHPSISKLIRQTQYPLLQDDPCVSTYPEVTGMRRRLFWMHHDKPENEDVDSMSRTNAYEVDMVGALVKHLVQQGTYKPFDIAVITPYLGQLRALRQKFSSTHSIMLNERDIDRLAEEEVRPQEPDITSLSLDANAAVLTGTLDQALRLATVDNFQGEEAKVVIVSLVRSNKSNTAGFLKMPNRINVMLSRAQHGMYIIGNANTAESVPMFKEVLDILRQDGNLGEALELCCPRHPETPITVQNPAEFARLSPEAGCGLLCEKQLSCGHACVAKCHSDMMHAAVYCLFAIPNAEVVLDCGHKKTEVACFEYQKPSLVKCSMPVKRTIPGCNHAIITECHVNVDQDAICQECGVYDEIVQDS